MIYALRMRIGFFLAIVFSQLPNEAGICWLVRAWVVSRAIYDYHMAPIWRQQLANGGPR